MNGTGYFVVQAIYGNGTQKGSSRCGHLMHIPTEMQMHELCQNIFSFFFYLRDHDRRNLSANFFLILPMSALTKYKKIIPLMFLLQN